MSVGVVSRRTPRVEGGGPPSVPPGVASIAGLFNKYARGILSGYPCDGLEEVGEDRVLAGCVGICLLGGTTERVAAGRVTGRDFA